MPVIHWRNNNKCYKCKKRIGRSSGLTIMFPASYLLIFTVVANFVTSQPVTNLQARNNKLIKTPTTPNAAAVTTTTPTVIPFPSNNDYYSSSSAASSNPSSDSSLFHSGSNRKGNTTGSPINASTTTAPPSGTDAGAEIEQDFLPPAPPLSIPVVNSEEEKLSSNYFGNGKEDYTQRATAAVVKKSEVNMSNPANHSLSESPPPWAHSFNNGNDNAPPLTLTNTLSNSSSNNNTLLARAGSAILKIYQNKNKRNVEVERKTVVVVGGPGRDKDKVMLTDDARGSSSTVNLVSTASSSSSSSFSSQNGNSPSPFLVENLEEDATVDKAVKMEGEEKEKKVNRTGRIKVNIITTMLEGKEGSVMDQDSKVNLFGSNLNVKKSESQRLTSTGAGIEANEKQEAVGNGEITATTITTRRQRKENKRSSNGVRNGSSDGEDDYYYPHHPGSSSSDDDVVEDETKKMGGYANVVNNNVNFVEEHQHHQQEAKTTEKQQGFDTDYNNKTRASLTGTRVEQDFDESLSNDKDNGASVTTAPPAVQLSGKVSIFTSTTPTTSSISSTGSSSTSPGNLMKSTRQRRPVTEMKRISSPVPVLLQVAVDKKNNKERFEDRTTTTATVIVGDTTTTTPTEEHDTEEYEEKQYSFYVDYAYDSPKSPILLTRENVGDTTTKSDGSLSWSSLIPSPSSSASSPLLMNKWIKTLVKLSQCRANCLDQAGIHPGVSSFGRSDLENDGSSVTTTADNQKEAGASGAAPSHFPRAPFPAPTTSNGKELNKEEKPKTPAVVYLEQMKKEKRSNPLLPSTMTTPGRTIKLTRSKSMKYYELSNCQKLCQRKFPLEDFHFSPPPNLDDIDYNNHFSNFFKDTPESAKRENKDGILDVSNDSRNNNNIINDRSYKNDNYHQSSTASGNNGNENNGSNNSNPDNNNSNERIVKEQGKGAPILESERSGGSDDDDDDDDDGVSAAVDRKSNNNLHQQHHAHLEEGAEQETQLEKQKHHYLPSSARTPAVVKGKQVLEGKAIGVAEDTVSGENQEGDGREDGTMMKLLAIEAGIGNGKKNKERQQQQQQQQDELNNFETFPSETGLKVGQVSYKEKMEGNVARGEHSFVLPSMILQLSWPNPASEDWDENGNNKSKKPEGKWSTFSGSPSLTTVAEVKGKKRDFDSGEEGNKMEEKAQRGRNMVYSIILEETWNDGRAEETKKGCCARRWKLIDQTVARTTTQISLPLPIVDEREKVPTERKRKEDEDEEMEEKNNNRSGQMSLTRQKMEGILSLVGRLPTAGAFQEKEEEIKVRENKKKEKAGEMMSTTATTKPLSPPPLFPPHPEQRREEKWRSGFYGRSAPSKVTVRVLAVSRNGLEKVFSREVKVNNSFWDYHLNGQQDDRRRHHPVNDQQVYHHHPDESLNQQEQEQADDSKTWTHPDIAPSAASDSRNNRPISSRRPTTLPKFSQNDDDDDDDGESDGNENGGEGKRSSRGSEQIEKVDKLNEKKKVDGEKEEDKNMTTRRNATTTISSDFNGTENNLNEILVFPSKELARQTLGSHGLPSGERKGKKLMSRLKGKKKQENEVGNDNHLRSNMIEISPSSAAMAAAVVSSIGKQVGDVGNRKPETNFPLEDETSNNISNEVDISNQKSSLKEQVVGQGGNQERKEVLVEAVEKGTQNWGLHTVSMIYQKFLVVTQVTWHYPEDDDDSERKFSFSNSATNNTKNGTTSSSSPMAEVAEGDPGKGTTKNSSAAVASSSSSSPPHKKWKGCGSRASNSNGGNTEIEEQQQQQLNFLLSWEIFGGGLRGNLVTDTCSASISLWPDTAYIIQVGLITPSKINPAAQGEMSPANGQLDSYSSYLTAWQNSYNSRAARQSPPGDEDARGNNNNNKNGNLPSNHVSHVSNYVNENTAHSGHDDDDNGGNKIHSAGEDLEENILRTLSSSTSPAPSSFDPLILPESIIFPFDGEPKVTIKSERILVNTTRAQESKLEGEEEEGGSDAKAAVHLSAIHNQDKGALGSLPSNNNFPPLKQAQHTEKTTRAHKWNDNEENDEQVVVVKKSFFREASSRSSSSGRNDSHPVSGINDKTNVSPITITTNGHSENSPGPAFEEEEEMLLLQENDQPEAESLSRLSSVSSHQREKVERTPAVVAATAGVNEDQDAAADQENSSVWSDEDEDDATDQDESLFARSLAHQNHHLHQQQRQEHQHSPGNNNNDFPPPPPYRTVSLPQPHTQTAQEIQTQQQQYRNNRNPPKSVTSKFHSFMTVNSFYQSLYALSRNALELSHRYPNNNVITLTNSNDGSSSSVGGGGSNNKLSNGSSSSSSSSIGPDSNIGPLLIGEFGNSNRTGYLFTTSHNTGGNEDDSEGLKGKLYTLFVILVISFVIFLFIVAIVGFCVLTSSIKENYKYFVPKKVRVWTTVGQLLKGSNNQGGSGSSSSGEGSGGGLFKDSAEGSFYPRRLQEEPDYEFDDNDDFDPDEEEEDEEASSVAETDDEDEESECDCQCVIDNDSREGGEEEEENSFSLNERCSSDTVKLIRDGEESSVELTAVLDDDNGEGRSSYGSGAAAGGGGSCGRGDFGKSNNKNSINSSNGCRGSHQRQQHHHRGNCDNNNPCYHATPGTTTSSSSRIGTGRIFQATRAGSVAAALSSLKKNFHRVSSSAVAASVAKQGQQQRQHHNHNHHQPHCPHYQQQHKRKSDTRIDVTGNNSRNGRNSLLNQRQEGYY